MSVPWYHAPEFDFRSLLAARNKRYKHLKTTLKKQVKALLRTLPLASSYLRARDLQARFSTELNLIAGKDIAKSAHPSILHFSVNKAATQYIKRVLGLCAEECGLVNVSIHDYAFHGKFPYLDSLSPEEMQDYQHIFRPQGYCYSVFGGMLDGVPDLDRYRIVLVLRDPRDVLVSSYFSVAFSHVAPGKESDKREEFIQMRARAQSSSIDEYVLAESDRTLANYERYKRLLTERYPHAYVTQYEQMTADFAGWLKELLEYCELDVPMSLFTTLVQKHDAKRPRQENVQQHTRKGRPGDYLEKLQPATIAQLNHKFAPILDAYGYS